MVKPRCLFVCTYSPLETEIKSGGLMLTKANYTALAEFFDITLMPTFKHKQTIFDKGIRLVSVLFGFMGGNNFAFEQKWLTAIEELKPDLIFIDHSQLGRLAKLSRNNYLKNISKKEINIITSFQNIEPEYFKHSSSYPWLLRYLLSWVAAMNEQMAVDDSSFLLTLTQEDSNLLQKRYGRSADIIIPITLITDNKSEIADSVVASAKADSIQTSNAIETATAIESATLTTSVPSTTSVTDRANSINGHSFKSNSHAVISPSQSPYLLFCGSYFPPNREAVLWFVKEVLDSIHLDLLVVGYQMEKMRDLVSHPKLKIIGTVDDIAPYFNSAEAIINPVLRGAGMNTKSVEAMKYGKRLLATSHALVGFPMPRPPGIIVCNNSNEFITVLKDLNQINNHEVEIKNYFEKYFHINSRINSLKKIVMKT